MLKIVGRAHDAILEQFHLKKGFLEGSNETSANATAASGGLEGDLKNNNSSLLVNATANNNTINSSDAGTVLRTVPGRRRVRGVRAFKEREPRGRGGEEGEDESARGVINIDNKNHIYLLFL